jgi:hypothetical protein
MEIHRFSRKQGVGPRPTTRLPARDPDMQDANHSRLQELIQQLSLLRTEMLELEVSGLAGCSEVHPEHTASALNLMHYLALRRHDIRHLQSQLAEMGLSSLGRTESHVLSALDAVVKLLRKLEGSEEANAQPSNTATIPRSMKKVFRVLPSPAYSGDQAVTGNSARSAELTANLSHRFFRPWALERETPQQQGRTGVH